MAQPSETPARWSRELVDRLSRTDVYREYARVFQETVGVPLHLRALEAGGPPRRGSPDEDPLRARIAAGVPGSSTCRSLQSDLEAAGDGRPRTIVCAGGLCESAVPIRIEGSLAAFLQAGPVLLDRPDRRALARMARGRGSGRAAVEARRAAKAYFRIRAMTKEQHESILRLLSSFALHLAVLGSRIIAQEKSAESPQISRAKRFIDEHQAEDLTLGAVACSVSMSAFYFCKTFRHSTGLTFTDYLARVRVDKVKDLLLDPAQRVSEAAFTAGFQSLSQFNRVFRKVAGEAPTAYRARIHSTEAA